MSFVVLIGYTLLQICFKNDGIIWQNLYHMIFVVIMKELFNKNDEYNLLGTLLYDLFCDDGDYGLWTLSNNIWFPLALCPQAFKPGQLFPHEPKLKFSPHVSAMPHLNINIINSQIRLKSWIWETNSIENNQLKSAKCLF